MFSRDPVHQEVEISANHSFPTGNAVTLSENGNYGNNFCVEIHDSRCPDTRNAINAVKTASGADIGTDHCPVIARICVKLKKAKEKPRTALIDVRKISDEKTKKELEEDLARGFGGVANGTQEIEEMWQNLEEILNEASEKHLRAKRKPDK
ncbi:hypothetical protein HHI36_006753 [Cryptolaemus montrouzieri]|uniref:Uncharacterized protein n=1 Tax=Cryptolaemus montrouzieri TaxID=559131 RepID=A0ABD2NYS7_9CUCU